MIDLHGLILADRSANELRELVMCRTAASVPFAGRYRLIDFSLSSLQNAGVRDVGVIMQQDYQSLLDHIGSGKECIHIIGTVKLTGLGKSYAAAGKHFFFQLFHHISFFYNHRFITFYRIFS